VSDDSAAVARLTGAAFLARALRRLAAVHPVAATGDHTLNPGMTPRNDYRDAAVLIPVIDRAPLSVLFTLRTPRLTAHAGQVSFPGGKIDATDASAAEAALREAHEEIGLDPASVTVIGEMAPYLTGTGFRVAPVLGLVAPPQSFHINHDEVAEIFEVPLAVLLAPGAMQRKTRLLGGRERSFYEMEFGGHVIWGATAGMIVALTGLLADPAIP
jgi:8-oxo-dGTP pyrophosphatase MutT (NUDIX family)